MELKTYRAKSLQEALQLVRRELGPEAAVLHAREVRQGPLRWLAGRRFEVTASTDVHVPSRFASPPHTTPSPSTSPSPSNAALPSSAERSASPASSLPEAAYLDDRGQFRDGLQAQIAGLQSLVEELCAQRAQPNDRECRGLPETMFRLFADLIEAEFNEEVARSLIDQLRTTATDDECQDLILMKGRLLRLIENELPCAGPIRVTPGQRRLVALVGPTGVGKTTTIAKLAANFHLRERRRVGLITVDTYRIAAVDQLRTYADIIDLPMEVVSTPREMRAALARLAHLDLILMDTAGRSPRDEVRIQELKSLLAEAQADEVHLVLSSVAHLNNLQMSTERFAEVGATSLLMTKTDEATGLGNLLPVLRHSGLPLSYVTHGQNVPEDISAADRRVLARAVLKLDQAVLPTL